MSSRVTATVAVTVMAGVACALPAFAATGSGQAGLVQVCPPSGVTSTASASATASAPSTDPATATASDSATDTGDPTSVATSTGPGDPTTTAAPTATASSPDCLTIVPPAAPPSSKAPSTPPTTASTTAPPTTAPPVAISTTSPSSTFSYIDTPPGNSNVQLPHGTITRAQIITRAELWLTEKVPYSQTSWWTDADGTYRQDCSGYVSMAWDLDQNIDFWTGNLNTVSHTIDPSQLQPGDNLMSVEHTILFAGWANPQHTEFDFFEEAHPGTEARFVVDAPLADYIDNGFSAFEYDGVLNSATLPADPATGIEFASLSTGLSELVPAGVSTDEPAPAPWQTRISSGTGLAFTPPSKAVPADKPVLAAMAMDVTGPAPMGVLFAAVLLAAFAFGLVLTRKPRIRLHRRRH